MPTELSLLMATAASIAFFHTVAGPDHYVPFIAMSRLGRWSMTKTAWVTLLCGLGHVLGSVALAMVGIAFGIALKKLQAIESARGDWAAWALTAFGLVYCVWGLRRAYRNRPHTHGHAHSDGHEHVHEHVHTQAHTHVHSAKDGRMTPWVLFTIFVFGPCEVLIPLVMEAAVRLDGAGVTLVTAVFGVVTVGTMMSLVLAAAYSGRSIPLGRLERYSHAMAGAAVFLCGVSIQCLGL
ncbi:MAG: sulfite exporter TauE/SafE family protein [Planctomycetaceae bacterium]|nr:sulfite exporter TauE/SafE family protein [Planctomycetaceae bacterium]